MYEVTNFIRNAPFSSYLRRRQQYIKVNNTKSKSSIIDCSIPQGTVLTPILFTIYIIEFIFMDTKSKIVLYANDTVLPLRGDDWKEVEEKTVLAFSKVIQWLNGFNKTKFMCFTIYDTLQPD